jgi:ATP-dependent Clp protease ATP-binding subunit ClpC
MFERYTEAARRALFFARLEASQLGHTSIETVHLLLGISHEGRGVTGKLFALSHASYDAFLAKVQSGPEKISTSVEIPFTAESKRVLDHAAREADALGHSYIGTEHLLLGLLREEGSAAGAILSGCGMRLADVRDQLRQLLDSSSLLSIPESDVHDRSVHIARIRQSLERLEHAPAGSGDARDAINAIRRTLDAL